MAGRVTRGSPRSRLPRAVTLGSDRATGGRTRPFVEISPLLRLILDIAARRGDAWLCSPRVGHRGESSPTGVAPRIVPRLRTSPTLRRPGSSVTSVRR